MYLQGEAVEKNLAEGAKWALKAANQGQADAQYMLGVLYSGGQGVEKDSVQAYTWVSLTIGNGTDFGSAAVTLKSNLEQNLSPDQLAQARRRIKRLSKK
jgi:TPR repeat protein